MCVCVCVRVRVCARVCMCVLDREGSWVFASTGLAVLLLVLVWMDAYLTSCSDYLTGFCEPFLPPYTSYRCMSHWFEK